MRSTKVIHVVSCHAEGEVGDVILGGVQPHQVTQSGSSRVSSLAMRPCETSCSMNRAEVSSVT